MDVHDSLYWLVTLSTVLVAARIAVQRPFPWGWCCVLVLLAVGLLIGRRWLPQQVGYVAAGYWVAFILAPMLGQRLAVQCVARRRPRLARLVARGVTLLHPADGWGATREFIEALIALQQGRQADAALLLDRLQDAGSPVGRSVIALQVRHTGQWQRFLAWLEHMPDRDALLFDGNLVDIYLQALGETGQRCTMLHEYARRLHRSSHPSAQLRVAALTGEVPAVERLLQGPLRGWPPEVREYWRGTVLQVAGRSEDAAALLTPLTTSDNALIARLARHRLDSPLAPLGPEELDAQARQALDVLRSDVEHEARFAVMSSTPYRRPFVTLAIALLLAGNFAREIPGGTQDLENLIELGALVIPSRPYGDHPQAPRFDEWWRPITAAFLHFGWAHFLMNSAALLYLGSRLERAWGHLWTLGCYAAAVAVSMSLTPWLLEGTTSEIQILAGASGGIMGLLGGLLGYLVIGRLRRHTPLVARQLTLLIGFVLLQTLFDLTHQEVSQQAHLLGLATGVGFGLLVGGCSSSSRVVARHAPVS
jgi:rhomboid protease GluP